MAVFAPGTGSDDCYAYPAGTINLTDARLYIGDPGVDVTAGIRFLSLGIPAGSTINSAKITVRAAVSATRAAASVNITGELVADAATFSTYANFSGRGRTTANVDWTPEATWLDGTDYDTPSLVAILQEIVDQGTWASGGDVVLFLHQIGTTYHQCDSYDGDATYCPRLTVTWTEAAGGLSIPVAMAQMGQFNGGMVR
jgi:hypothetical protein